MARSAAKANPARWLYVAFSLLLLVATVAGFQQFYFHGKAYPGREIVPRAKVLVVGHGLVMSAWIVLFVVQPLLIVNGNRRLHMTLGRIGAVLAAGIVILGLMVPVAVVRYGPEFPLWGLNRRQFMAVPMFIILLFAAFVAIGVWNRRRPDIHRPMMFLATLAVVTAALNRIPGLGALYAATIWGRVFGPFFVTLVIGAAFLVAKSVLTRSLDRYYAIGYGVLVVAFAAIYQIATTAAWFRFASFLVG